MQVETEEEWVYGGTVVYVEGLNFRDATKSKSGNNIKRRGFRDFCTKLLHYFEYL